MTMTGNAIIKSALVLVLLTGVRSQVCTRIVRTNKSTTVNYTSNDRICPKCPLRNILKTRLETVPYEQTVSECCSGYKKKVQNLDPSSDNCVPFNCEKQCNNGHCSVRDECECYKGYEKHPTQNTCIYKCNAGYMRVSVVCVPHCSKPCHGGRCVAPNKCSCDQGWTLNKRGECIQNNPDSKTCDPPCGNGTCDHGNRCNCWDGYEFNKNAILRCVPTCKNCTGLCGTPGRCEFHDYQERKHATADGRDCDYSEDCNTKCHKSVCVPATSTSTSPTIPQTPMDPSNEPNDSEDLKVYVVVQRTSKPDTRCTEPVENDESLDPWLIVFIFTTIIMVTLIVLVIQEYLRK